MKILILSVAIMLLALVTSADNQKTISNSEITAVKVFLNGAQIDRTFKTSLDAGVTTIAVTNLSSQIDQQSVTVNSKSDLMILGTSFSLDYLNETKISPHLKALRDSLDL